MIWERDGQALLAWHRGKAGTIEQVHRVLKDELAAGVYLSAKFGANAAWLRLQVLTHNLLELLKASALAPEYRRARPKRLRFAIFTQFGRVVDHARRRVVRIVSRVWGSFWYRLGSGPPQADCFPLAAQLTPLSCLDTPGVPGRSLPRP